MEDNKMEYKYICKECNYKCKFESTWKKHIATELHRTGKRKKRTDCKEPKKCDKCNYQTKNATTLKTHILNEHANKKIREKEFKCYCKYCDFGTFSNDIMNLHNKTKKHKKYILRLT